MSEHESDANEVERDPWDERDAFLDSEEAEYEPETEVLVEADEGEDPLA